VARRQSKTIKIKCINNGIIFSTAGVEDEYYEDSTDSSTISESGADGPLAT